MKENDGRLSRTRRQVFRRVLSFPPTHSKVRRMHATAFAEEGGSIEIVRPFFVSIVALLLFLSGNEPAPLLCTWPVRLASAFSGGNPGCTVKREADPL